jgi:hypothetical protein
MNHKLHFRPNLSIFLNQPSKFYIFFFLCLSLGHLSCSKHGANNATPQPNNQGGGSTTTHYNTFSLYYSSQPSYLSNQVLPLIGPPILDASNDWILFAKYPDPAQIIQVQFSEAESSTTVGKLSSSPTLTAPVTLNPTSTPGVSSYPFQTLNPNFAATALSQYYKLVITSTNPNLSPNESAPVDIYYSAACSATAVTSSTPPSNSSLAILTASSESNSASAKITISGTNPPDVCAWDLNNYGTFENTPTWGYCSPSQPNNLFKILNGGPYMTSVNSGLGALMPPLTDETSIVESTLTQTAWSAIIQTLDSLGNTQLTPTGPFGLSYAANCASPATPFYSFAPNPAPFPIPAFYVASGTSSTSNIVEFATKGKIYGLAGTDNIASRFFTKTPLPSTSYPSLFSNTLVSIDSTGTQTPGPTSGTDNGILNVDFAPVTPPLAINPTSATTPVTTVTIPIASSQNNGLLALNGSITVTLNPAQNIQGSTPNPSILYAPTSSVSANTSTVSPITFTYNQQAFSPEYTASNTLKNEKCFAYGSLQFTSPGAKCTNGVEGYPQTLKVWGIVYCPDHGSSTGLPGASYNQLPVIIGYILQNNDIAGVCSGTSSSGTNPPIIKT